MNSEIRFKSLDELYKRLYPAFNARKKELQRENVHVTELDLWNFLKDTTWIKNDELSLSDMVSDIFNVNKISLLKYVKHSRGEEK